MKALEIAEFLGGELVGDGSVMIESVSSLSAAVSGDIAFIEKGGAEFESSASCIIVPVDFTAEPPQTLIRIRDPKLAFAIIAKKLKKQRRSYSNNGTAAIAATAEVKSEAIGNFVSIGEHSSLAEGSEVGDGTRIGQNVKIGRATVIHPNCVIYDDVEIGNECVIHAGTVIGADGFGYVKDVNGEYHQFPQIGTVVIEDRVEIGANSCIDRGALGETRIGEGTKIDNLVQIAHNVKVGKRVVIAAQTGISGSTVIEDDCVIGGQVGMGDHARVLSGAVIGSQAGILPGKIVRPGVWWGTPVQPLDEYKRQHAQLKGISRLTNEIREIRNKLSTIDKSKGSESQD